MNKITMMIFYLIDFKLMVCLLKEFKIISNKNYYVMMPLKIKIRV